MSREQRPVFLIGLPACGKTTLGRALPVQMEALGLRPVRFIDLDEAVEARAGMSIAEIFASSGEGAFRELESSLLRELTATATDGPLVIACGGGTPCTGDNMDFMLRSGTVVELHATREATLRRLLEAPREQRPLVSRVHGDPEALAAEVEALAARRAPWYSRAHTRFDSTRLESEAEVAATATAFIRQFL